MHLSLYQAATAVAARAIQRGKTGASLAGRSGAAGRWTAWAARHRRGGPLLWIHAASVGEAQAADPVIRRLLSDPSLQVVRSFSSSSAEGWRRDPPCPTEYVPLDTRSHVAPTLDALRPTALIFSRGDLWPVLVGEAIRRGIPVAVIGGVVRTSSRRLRWPARSLLQGLHQAIAAVGAVAEADASGWRALGVRPSVIAVTGDPRHDAVIERPVDLDSIRPVLAWRGDRGPVVVAGSVEPSDEGALLAAAGSLAADRVRWLVAPHEPDASSVSRLVAAFAAQGVETVRWGGGPIASSAGAVVVTTRGRLADLYCAADAAYVGGGFSRRGTHSLAEPASLGVPIAFGANGTSGVDEQAIASAGGGVALNGADAGVALAQQCRHWFAAGGVAGRSAGIAARRALSAGAAQLSATLVLRSAGLA